MKCLLIASALLALTTGISADEPSTKTKRGLLGLEHAPTLISAPLLKSYETPIIHSAPVITKVFDAPPLPLVRGYEPLITGPLIAKGWGPHIIGAKTILPAPIVSHAPIISLAPKWPILGHGW